MIALPGGHRWRSTPRGPFVLALLQICSVLGLFAPGEASAAECSPTPGNHRFEMVLDEVERTYLVHVPQGCDPELPMPLVFDFHGLTSTAAEQTFTGFRQKADEEGFVVVHPQGHGRSWNAGWCCSLFGDAPHRLDDVAFVRAMLEKLATDLPIDRTRVYATGLSNGGAMSHWLACNAADVFAAAAPVSYHLSLRDACDPVRPVPVLQIHGTSDGTVPYEKIDSPTTPWPSAPDSIARWAGINGCEPEPERIIDLPFAYCDVHPSCEDAASAGLCTLVGAPHVPYEDAIDAGMPIPDVVWEFFSQRTLPAPEPHVAALQAAALTALGVARAHRRRSSAGKS